MRITIIGGGPAGFTAALEAAQRGCCVTLVERRALGGVCLNHGCIPTKTLRASADALVLARRLAEYGVTGLGAPAIDAGRVQARRSAVIDTLRAGLAQRCIQAGVTLLAAEARVLDARRVALRPCQGTGQGTGPATDPGAASGGNDDAVLEGDALILAPGSRQRRLPGLEPDHAWICDSDDALELDTVPASVLIAGGGVVGCELACIYAAFGSRVTVVEPLERALPLPSVDADISALLEREMRKRKIRLLTGRRLETVEVDAGAPGGAGRVRAVATDVEGRRPAEVLEADRLFVAAGREPDTAGLGLEQAGVRLDAAGWIAADAGLRTSLDGIWAAGDALGPSRIMLAHVAAAEGAAIVDTLCGGQRRVNYAAVPSAIFTAPELGCAGLTEAQARAAGVDTVCGITHLRALGRAHAMGELPGFVKLVADRQDGRILGIHLAGAHASDLLGEAALALSLGARLRDVAETVHAHPTLAEAFGEAAATALRAMPDGAPGPCRS